MTGEIAPSGPSERSAVWVPYVVRRAERTFAVDAMPADRSVGRSSCGLDADRPVNAAAEPVIAEAALGVCAPASQREAYRNAGFAAPAV